MSSFFAHISLKRLASIFTLATLIFLLLVIVLATKQYLLYRQCESLVEESQHILFQFTGIKEHINERYLLSQKLDTLKVIGEIQELDGALTRILDDVLIPEEFKLSFISQVDLIHLTVALRNLGDSTNVGAMAEILSQLRAIHTKLTAFNQLIGRYTQNQLLGLHKALAGMLASITAAFSLMLFWINHYITSPLIHLSKELFPEEKGKISLFSLNTIIQNLASRQGNSLEPSAAISQENSKDLSRLYRNSSIGNLLNGISNELTNRSNGILNYTQALLDISQDMHLDQDSRTLLQKLLSEEKKMSELLMHIIQFTSVNDEGTVVSMSLEKMFSSVTGLLQGTLKNDQISLRIDLSHPEHLLNYHVSDLQLVILAALQSSRAALNRLALQSSNDIEKTIQIRFSDETLDQQKIRIIIEDNGAPWQTDTASSLPTSERPWHNMRFCNDFLHTFGGKLDVHREQGNQNRCIIEIPSHKTEDK